MTVILVQILSEYKRKVGFVQDDFPAIAREILDHVSTRVTNPDLIPSYQIFILSKIDMAFKIAIKTKKEAKNTVDESDIDNSEMLDIPIEEFQGVVIDEEFCKLIGYNE